MFKKSAYKKVALAAALGALFTANAANAHVTYNTNGDPDNPDGSQAGPWTDGNPGYTGSLPATWVAMIHNHGGAYNSQTASSAGAGFLIGMGAKSYKDPGDDLLSTDDDTNWGHSADYGLFKLEHDATVTITVSSDNSDLRPAFGLWSGWATGGSRHDAYLGNGALLPMAANPLDSGLGLVDVDAWAYAATQGATASATLTRFLTAGNYTLILGGYEGTTKGTNLAYTATITAVPLPGAVWLFGSAMAGLVGFSRRKAKLTS